MTNRYPEYQIEPSDSLKTGGFYINVPTSTDVKTIRTGIGFLELQIKFREDNDPETKIKGLKEE